MVRLLFAVGMIAVASACSKGKPAADKPAAVPQPPPIVRKAAAPVAVAPPSLPALPKAPIRTFADDVPRFALAAVSNGHGQFDRFARPAHGKGGFARRLARLAFLRKTEPALLHVEVGNALVAPPGELVYVDRDPAERLRRAAFVAEGLGRMGLDALVPGPDDLSMGAKALVAWHLPWLASNVTVTGASAALGPARIVAVAKLPVGLFGVVFSAQAQQDRAVAAGFSLSDPVAAAVLAAGSLREQGARVVIGLIHAQNAADILRIAQAVPGLDLIVVSGLGTLTAEARLAGAVPVVEAGRDGKALMLASLALPAGQAGLASVRVVPLDGERGEDKAMANQVMRYTKARGARAEAGLILSVDPRLANATPQKGGPKALAARPAPNESWTFGSTGACVLCHQPQTEQWKTTAHAFAAQSLQPSGRSRDPECLPCHSTAFLRPGGTASLATANAFLSDVGCETCHGPSIDHIRATEKKGKMPRVQPLHCSPCHAGDSAGDSFDYAGDLKAVMGPGHGAVAK